METVSFWKLFVLALSLCSRTLASDESNCENYGEDWECPKNETSSGLNTISCANLISETMELIAKGEENIRYSNDSSAVMVIGITGTGKSTFVYFTAGDENRLVAIREGEFRPTYSIRDCNGKIVEGSVSGTIYPDLVYDNITQKNFYDNPGFDDTRDACVEIANAYFMINVTSMLSRVQFVIALDDENFATRDGLTKTLSYLIHFLRGIDKFTDSLTLVLTKVGFSSSSDEQQIAEIIPVLEKRKLELPDTFINPEELRKATLILDTFINKQSVIVFRTPDKCGPLGLIPLMQKNKLNISKKINETKFTDCIPSDFNLTLSEKSKSAIRDVVDKLYPEVKDKLKNFVFQTSAKWASDLVLINDVYEKRTAIEVFKNSAKTIVAVAEAELNSAVLFSRYLKNVTSMLIENAPFLEKEILEMYDNYSIKIDFLEKVIAAGADAIDWKKTGWNFFNTLEDDLENDSIFVRMMVGLFEELSSAKIHSEDPIGYKKWYADNPSDVTSLTVDNFWDKFGPIISKSGDVDQLKNALNSNPKNNFETLNSVLHTTLPPFVCPAAKNSVVVFEGKYLNFKNVFNVCKYEALQIVVVLALNSTFIDTNVNGISFTGKNNDGLNIIVISPRIIAEIQNPVIDLVPLNPPALSQIECCGNIHGETGTAGYKGGSFNAITTEMSKQYKFSVNCSGGAGGIGQEGQMGKQGRKGSTQNVRDHHDADCDAWSGGQIEVKVHPNDCNPPGLKCHAGEGGRQVKVYGAAGYPGEPGGEGGSGGAGGSPGECKITCELCGDRYTLISSAGVSGASGKTGASGQQGECGNTMIFRMDDLYDGSDAEKFCRVYHPGQEVAHVEGKDPCKETPASYNNTEASGEKRVAPNNRHEAGLNYRITNLRSAKSTIPKFELRTIDEYINQFKTYAETFLRNPFIGKKLKEFVDSI